MDDKEKPRSRKKPVPQKKKEEEEVVEQINQKGLEEQLEEEEKIAKEKGEVVEEKKEEQGTQKRLKKEKPLSQALPAKSLNKEDINTYLAQILDQPKNLNSFALPALDTKVLEQARVLVKSGILPDSVDRPEAAIAIMVKGKELGFGPMASFEHIIVVKGKATLDGVALGAVLQRGGVEWEVIKNAEKTYEMDENDKPKKFATVPVTGGKKGETRKIPWKDEYYAKGLEPGPKIVNVTTEIKLYRESKLLKKVKEHISSFSYAEARAADLTGKDNWKHYLKSMLFWRALSIGARQIAPDLIMGMITAEEADPTGSIALNETGNVIHI